MNIRAYLRASTKEQDASRARKTLQDFAAEKGVSIVSWYTENASGAVASRPELTRLLADALPGDIILVESIDRLSRMKGSDWKALSADLKNKEVLVVAVDLPTSHMALKNNAGDEFTKGMVEAVNNMMIDMMAVIAHKDYEQRRERQRQGIDKAKSEGKYRGRPVDHDKHDVIARLLGNGLSIRQAAETAGCSTYTVQKVKAGLDKA